MIDLLVKKTETRSKPSDPLKAKQLKITKLKSKKPIIKQSDFLRSYFSKSQGIKRTALENEHFVSNFISTCLDI